MVLGNPMARAYQQSQPVDYDGDRGSSEWQSLRQELVALLDEVDGQVARTRADSPLSERVRDVRHQLVEAEQHAPARPRETPRPAAGGGRDSLQAAIDQIRSRQGVPVPRREPAAPPPAARGHEGAVLEQLAQAVTGIAGRLERVEGDIKAQLKSGASVKDVADQVAQLAHVVELLAGAVGETGQVKRLEGQIASLGRIMSQGREMDVATLTRRLDDVAATVGKLAELQVHFTDKLANPAETDGVRDGMRAIEEGVRSVYDRIDALEKHATLSPADLDHLTGEMARFTETLRESGAQPHNLVELVDALNTRISDIESGDRILSELRGDLAALREAVTGALAPRFDALEERLAEVGTRADMAEIGRQIDRLHDRLGERQADPGVSQLEVQVRQLVARMDQTGEQLSGLARLYSDSTAGTAPELDFDAMAEMVASRAAEAVSRQAPDRSFAETIDGLEARITAMLKDMQRDSAVDDFGGMEAGISEVNDRLRRLESSLAGRPVPLGANPEPAPVVPAADMPGQEPAAPEPEPEPEPLPTHADAMPRDPAEDAPLTAPPFPEPRPEAEPKASTRRRHPGLDAELSLAALYDSKPAAPAGPPAFEPPPAPVPSADFVDAAPRPAIEAPRAAASDAAPVNTFIAAARRAAQRQASHAAPAPAAVSGSLIARALARFQPSESTPAAAKPERAPRALAGDKPARTAYTPEPVAPEPAPSLEARVKDEAPAAEAAAKESFLARNRRALLLAALLVAVGLLATNLVAQRMRAAPVEATDTAPVTTGDIAGEAPAPAAAPRAPRLIEPTDSLQTGAIDAAAAHGFTSAPVQTMPSAFAAATELASVDSVAPLVPEPSPIHVAPPPEGVGPQSLRDAAAAGDVRAQFEVAAIFTEGRAVPQDYAAAAMWYERAAAAGFVPAQYRLGALYESGEGVEKNLETAKLWYERAAEAGNRMSMHNLAALYAGGQLGKQQFDSAAKWFEEAARRGLTDSQFNLGMLYARGLGVPQSLEDSYKWFGIAALSGDKDAAKARDDIARSLDAEAMTRLADIVNNFKPEPIELSANFAPIGTWSKDFDPGETITTHDIVASVQKALGRLGYDIGTADGIAGTKTIAAIKAFEKATGMSQVGLVNPRLLAVLGSQPV
jgi:localization factor PodJL